MNKLDKDMQYALVDLEIAFENLDARINEVFIALCEYEGTIKERNNYASFK